MFFLFSLGEAVIGPQVLFLEGVSNAVHISICLLCSSIVKLL